ncbi:hypothetical protein CFBP3846_04418 [Pseudomonas syringae pv. avii]|uniref:Secreted protein n=2 Tax=Pseudomonas syringae group TaxID=136849 RepID=A0ABY1UC77_PSESX|nr:basic membrane lipoprotein [Pseudomonas syringae pv. persicae]SOQ13322.1 basic membrane lipoprotein [Pseudomonas syringae pv. persicae]SOS28812.1 hypothetical protein CFBP3846_04418 [Pseudomonas syringae pv. avii]
MYKKLLPGTLCAAVAFGAAGFAQAEGLTLKGPAKIAMVYISPRNDGGFRHSMRRGSSLKRIWTQKSSSWKACPKTLQPLRPLLIV